MKIYAKTRSRLAAVVLRRDTKAGVAFDYAVQVLVLSALAVFSIGTLPGLDRVNSDDFKGLETLRDITKGDFICGVVLYAGNNVVSFGEELLAVPLSALWQ